MGATAEKSNSMLREGVMGMTKPLLVAGGSLVIRGFRLGDNREVAG